MKTRNEAFVFVGVADVMVKLGPSLPAATELASSAPQFTTGAGAHGWVSIKFTPDSTPPLDQLEA